MISFNYIKYFIIKIINKLKYCFITSCLCLINMEAKISGVKKEIFYAVF